MQKNKIPPKIEFSGSSTLWEEAHSYVRHHIPDNPGQLNEQILLPVDFKESKDWLSGFLSNRIMEFGDYQDAIVTNESFLHHALLSPMMNIGLLTPSFMLKKNLDFHAVEEIPLNSLEGFIRQIIGWREFLRAIYHFHGRFQRTRNFLGFKRKMPGSYWSGTTGNLPVDATIKKVLNAAYAHHIERLMVLGNYMLLNKFDPDEVYRWFMSLFIDAYDWVMVPNVYGMSQFADGGLLASKPYISGSNYLVKMSDFKKGQWQSEWTSLFWHFMNSHKTQLKNNPRLNMLLKTYERMNEEQKEKIRLEANKILT